MDFALSILGDNEAGCRILIELVILTFDKKIMLVVPVYCNVYGITVFTFCYSSIVYIRDRKSVV